MLLPLLACTSAPPIRAIVDADRPEHFFDHPFPSDDLRDPETGAIDLAGFPVSDNALAASLEQGWVDRLELATTAFANHGAVYFRFDGPVAFPARTQGLPTERVLYLALDGTEILPADLAFVEDPLGDPHWAPNTLAVVPRLGHPPRSGGRYAVVVMATEDLGPAEGWTPPAEVGAALTALHVEGEVAVATTFTVQDATGQLRSLFADADTRLPDFSDVTLRRVVRISYAAGTTPSGNEATVFTATYEDGGEAVTYLSYDPGEVQTLDLGDGWPMVVYEATVPTLNYQDPEDRPYMSPGAATLGDTERFTGWIEHDAAGAVLSEPWTEPMRVVVSLPKGPDGRAIADAGVVVWDHGTAGHAYNVVQRASASDDSRALAEEYAAAGFATIGRDATLYGTRYPLVDEGFTDGSLGFYNVVNLPAFRDNQRQTAVDGHVLRRFVETALDARLAEVGEAGSVDEARLRRAGHSLGSVTANLGVAGEPDAWRSAFLSGTGGVFSHYVLDTGLLDGFDPAVFELVFSIGGVPAPEDPTSLEPSELLGALLGLDEAAWRNVNRAHPFFTLFQWTMDPSDPMSVARDEAVATFLSISPGDRQTPDFTAQALAVAQPTATTRICRPIDADGTPGAYDPHHCLWRSPEGPPILREWLDLP